MCAMDDLTTETQNMGIVKGILGKIFDIPLADRWMLHKSSINLTGCIIYLLSAFIGERLVFFIQISPSLVPMGTAKNKLGLV